MKSLTDLLSTFRTKVGEGDASDGAPALDLSTLLLEKEEQGDKIPNLKNVVAETQTALRSEYAKVAEFTQQLLVRDQKIADWEKSGSRTNKKMRASKRLQKKASHD